MNDFNKNLKYGQEAENKIVKYLRNNKYIVLTVCEIQHQGSKKGPRLFVGNNELIVPDLMFCKISTDQNKNKLTWADSKHKMVFSWYGKKQRWETGIDTKCYNHYKLVKQKTNMNVWLLFLHENDKANQNEIKKYGAPEKCPIGLYGVEIDEYQPRHSSLMGSDGMEFWQHNVLKKIATIEEFEKSQF